MLARSSRSVIGRVIGALSALLIAFQALGAAAAMSAEPPKSASSGVTLVMIEEIGCPYCVRWHEEIGSNYPKTDEGKFAPLITIFIHESEARQFKQLVYTPTFIVMNKGEEVGRILGYSGENFFWPMLEEILKKVGYDPSQVSEPTQ